MTAQLRQTATHAIVVLAAIAYCGMLLAVAASFAASQL
jgi:hypothetical protein